MIEELSVIPWWAWLFIITLLTAQGLWIFNDAPKRGMNRWIWGLFGLLNSPTNLVIYLLVSRVILKATLCESCGKKISGNFTYCPHCGEKQGE